MINLTIGQSQYVYLTVQESLTLSSPNYLFRFVQRTTNEEIKFVKKSSDDVSLYKERYSKFLFDVDQLFCGEIGEYYYYIYEQASASNLEIENTGKLLETGIMRLNPATDDVFTFTKYQTNNIFTTK